MLCVCVPVPAISAWSHGGCKDPPVATSFLQTAGQEMNCPNNAFPEGNAKAHTHRNVTEPKNQLKLKAQVGKTRLAGVFFCVWVCHGESAGIINVDTWTRWFGLVRKNCSSKGETASKSDSFVVILPIFKPQKVMKWQTGLLKMAGEVFESQIHHPTPDPLQLLCHLNLPVAPLLLHFLDTEQNSSSSSQKYGL